MNWSLEKTFQGLNGDEHLYYYFWHLRDLPPPLSLNEGVFAKDSIKSSLVVLCQ